MKYIGSKNKIRGTCPMKISRSGFLKMQMLLHTTNNSWRFNLWAVKKRKKYRRVLCLYRPSKRYSNAIIELGAEWMNGWQTWETYFLKRLCCSCVRLLCLRFRHFPDNLWNGQRVVTIQIAVVYAKSASNTYQNILSLRNSQFSSSCMFVANMNCWVLHGEPLIIILINCGMW